MRPEACSGRHVARRAGDHAGGRHLRARLEDLGQAEIGHVRLPVAVQQDVRGLQVAVDDALLVQVLDGPGHRGDDPHAAVARGTGPRAIRSARLSPSTYSMVK